MVGIVKNDIGIIFKNDNYKVVKKRGNRGEVIPNHNHPDEEIVFSIIKGRVKVILNDNEEYNLKIGDVLNFNGENIMSVNYMENSEIIITLIKK